MLVTWKFESPIQHFKNYFSSDFVKFKGQNICFPGKYFSFGIRNDLAQGVLLGNVR